MLEFSKNLKNERISQQLTQKQMAELLCVSYRTYQNYEQLDSNNREPDLETLVKIAKILNVSIDSLLGIEKI